MKKNYWFYCLFAGLVLVSFSLPSQANILAGPRLALDVRQNPSGVDWAMVRTDHFRVIFPRPLESEARRVLGILETVYGPVSEGLHQAPRVIDIILQAHVLNSNGFVTLAPRRSEWYVAPWMGPEIGQTEWLAALGVHEFRHVVQFERSRAGFEKFLRALFGETGTALAIGLSLPPWYLEGDAVGSETALSSGGRGRMPLFARDLRTLLLDGQSYTYEQLALRSFDRYAPNHYVFGYHFTTYLRRRFGKEILDKMHGYTTEWAFWPLSFFNALEHHTGVNFEVAYEDFIKELTASWRAQDALVQTIPVESFEVDGIRGWTNFSYPTRMSDGSVLAFREGLAHIGQFVRLTKNAKAEVLWTPAPLLQDFPFKVRAGKIAYTELSPHSRWGAQEFGKLVVKSVDGETLFRSGPSRWLLPVLDHNGERLAVFEWSYQGSPSILVLSLDGSVRARIPWARELAVMGLDWIPGTDRLVVLHRQGTYEQSFLELSFTGQRRVLARSSKWNWAFPVATSTHVYFQSSASGIDNIHRISLKDGLEERVTSEQFGAYHPSVTGNELTYARYTAQGLRPAFVSLGSVKVHPPGPDTFVSYHTPLVEQEGKGDVLATSTSSTVPLESYAPTKHAFNAHSWTILGNYFGSGITPALVSTDVLNYTQFIVGAGWNLNERTAQTYASARWSYLYPIFDLSMAFGNRRELELPRSQFNKNEDKWQEGSAEVGLTLPWVSVWRRWSITSALRLSGGILHTEGRVYRNEGDLGNDTLRAGSVEGSYAILQRQASRDLMPPWGLALAGQWQEGKSITRGDAELSAQKFLALRPFMPGVWHHHHLFGEVSHEENEKDGYHFVSPSLFSRGHVARFLEKRTKTSANYVFPLCYPDWNLGRYFYLKRISLNAFHDNTWGTRYGRARRFETAGTELWFDSHFLRNSFPIQWGVRYAHPTTDDEDDSVELFLNLTTTEF